MTLAEPTRRDLPMLDHVRGKRSAVTCQLKCANACLGPECNTSDNEHFRSIASAVFSRRALFGLGAAAATYRGAGFRRGGRRRGPDDVSGRGVSG